MVKVAKFVGLDVHKDTICMAVTQGGALQSIPDPVTLPHDVPKLVKRLLALAPAEHLRVVYEAGPTGFGLCRELLKRGIHCIIVAPNRVPQTRGPRVKTDKRDARNLAHQLRMGGLSPITLPDLELEALRDLLRAREDALVHRRRSRQQLKGFFLRHDVRCEGKGTWTTAYMQWARHAPLRAEALRLARDSYCDRIEWCDVELKRLTEQVEEIAAKLAGLHAKLYRTYQALRGVKSIVAATLVSELGDLTRFPSPTKLMGYLGMVPREESTGNRVWRGSITKAGNPHVRRVLVEAAWSGRLRPARGKLLKKRQENLSEPVIDIATRAQKRLYKRHCSMRAKGKPQNIAVVAMARELLGFIWAIGIQTANEHAEQAPA
jgi:transposase